MGVGLTGRGVPPVSITYGPVARADLGLAGWEYSTFLSLPRKAIPVTPTPPGLRPPPPPPRGRGSAWRYPLRSTVGGIFHGLTCPAVVGSRFRDLIFNSHPHPPTQAHFRRVFLQRRSDISTHRNHAPQPNPRAPPGDPGGHPGGRGGRKYE